MMRKLAPTTYIHYTIGTQVLVHLQSTLMITNTYLISYILVTIESSLLGTREEGDFNQLSHLALTSYPQREHTPVSEHCIRCVFAVFKLENARSWQRQFFSLSFLSFLPYFFFFFQQLDLFIQLHNEGNCVRRVLFFSRKRPTSAIEKTFILVDFFRYCFVFLRLAKLSVVL